MSLPKLGRAAVLMAVAAAVTLTVALSPSGAAVALSRAGVAHSGTASLPRVPADLGATERYLTIRPRTIVYTGDGTGLLGGPSARSTQAGISWQSWTATTATGTGDNLIDNCRPDCAAGRFTAYPVRLELWRPATERGQRVFTRLTIWYTASRPTGEPAHYTFTDIYADGWGFGPPGADGYCVHTYGQPKAAGCDNIDALP